MRDKQNSKFSSVTLHTFFLRLLFYSNSLGTRTVNRDGMNDGTSHHFKRLRPVQDSGEETGQSAEAERLPRVDCTVTGHCSL